MNERTVVATTLSAVSLGFSGLALLMLADQHVSRAVAPTETNDARILTEHLRARQYEETLPAAPAPVSRPVSGVPEWMAAPIPVTKPEPMHRRLADGRRVTLDDPVDISTTGWYLDPLQGEPGYDPEALVQDRNYVRPVWWRSDTEPKNISENREQSFWSEYRSAERGRQRDAAKRRNIEDTK